MLDKEKNIKYILIVKIIYFIKNENLDKGVKKMSQMSKKVSTFLMICLLVGGLYGCQKKEPEQQAKNQTLASLLVDVDLSKLPEQDENETDEAEETEDEETTDEETPESSPSHAQQNNSSKPSGSNGSQNNSSKPSGSNGSQNNSSKPSGSNESQNNSSTPSGSSESQNSSSQQETKPTQTPVTSSGSHQSEKQQILALVNEQRANQGLPALSYRSDLQAAADTRAQEIISQFSHTRPDGSNCFSVVQVSYRALGENIAWGQPTPAVVMERWMGSDGHRKNILDSRFTGLAVGVAESNGTMYWVQIFIG